VPEDFGQDLVENVEDQAFLLEVKIWVKIRVQDPGHGGEGSETEAASWLKENLCIIFDCVCFVRLFLLGLQGGL